MSEEHKCSRCGGRMEAGFLLDRRNHGTPQATAGWVEGTPEWSIWGIKTKGRERYRVETYRCEGCGYLESYAREPYK
ncbi:MAG: hypothetical protein JOZ02_01095 [Acidobacteria bacterium]|nr:hypothetical protein [Acidobacteriota bacterium]